MLKTMFNMLCVYTAKIRFWGIRGILNYPGIVWHRYKKGAFFRSNWNRYRRCVPAHGITVVASLSKSNSLDKVVRDFVMALKTANIPYQAIDWCEIDSHRVSTQELTQLLTPEAEFNIRKYDHIIGMFALPKLPASTDIACANIAFWEFASGFPEVYPEVARGGEIITMSDFNYDYFKSVFANGSLVRKILYPFRIYDGGYDDSHTLRERYGLSDSDFIVFYNFDFISTFGRKNPDGVMRAFAMALADVPHAKLVFKTMRAKLRPDRVAQLERLAKELAIDDRYVVIDQFIPERDVYGLTNACDVYLALHRGEGFGLPIVEAMSLGKPVITTGYSSVCEFCRSEHAMLVDCKEVPVNKDLVESDFYRYVKSWAEPDVEDAARKLRKLYVNPEFRKSLGLKAKEFVYDYFSNDHFKCSINEFMRYH